MIDTLPKLFKHNYERYGAGKTYMRKKNFGIWQSYSWKDCYERVKSLSLGLIALGLEPGDKVSILGDNDPEWIWAEFAIEAAGALPCGIFVDSMPPEVKYIVDHSQSKFVFAKDQEQCDKMLQIKDELPQLKKVIWWDPYGMYFYQDPILMGIDEVYELGRNYEADHPGLFEENVEKGKGDDIAFIMYTSGTTGLPKGAMLRHRNLLYFGDSFCAINPVTDTDEMFSRAPLPWIVGQLLDVSVGLKAGMLVSFPEEAETIEPDTRELGPAVELYPSRVWEGIAATIQAKISDTDSLKRFVYNLCLPVGYRVADFNFAGKNPPFFWKVIYFLAHQMLFKPLKDKLGLLGLKHAYTAGAALGPDTFRFFRGMGLNLKQIYGMTEAVAMTGHRDDNVDFVSIGNPYPNMQVRIADDSEILIQGASIFDKYYRDEEKTRETKHEDGWLYTGDAGYMDKAGRLIYWERKKDLIELPSGKKFSPQFIENRLKFSPYIRDAIVFGGRDKAYVSAVLDINFPVVGTWAEHHHLPYTTIVDLSQKAEVYELTKKEVAAVNATLPEEARIKKYCHLHKEFDADDAELTRTMKLRRKLMEERYADLMKALYQEGEEFVGESEVRYRDGRVGKARTTIRTVTMF